MILALVQTKIISRFNFQRKLAFIYWSLFLVLGIVR